MTCWSFLWELVRCSAGGELSYCWGHWCGVSMGCSIRGFGCLGLSEVVVGTGSVIFREGCCVRGVREGCYVGSHLFLYLARLTERLVRFGRQKIAVFPVLNPCRGDCHFKCMVACARIVIQKKEHLCS